MGLFGKKEKATFYKFLVVDGCVPSMSAPSTVKISLFPDQIEIRQIIGGKAVAYLSYSQVTAAAKVGEREIVEAAALVHDIGIHAAEKKYRSAAGEYQEIEGPWLAASCWALLVP